MQQSDMFSAPSSLTPRNDVYPFIAPEQHKGKLSGKIVIITGAGRGLGRAIAKAFAAAGARLICVARRKTDLDEVVEEINSIGGESIGVAADVTDPHACRYVLNECDAHFGSENVDILINNAGMTRFNTFENESEDLGDWWRVMEVNLKGPLLFIRGVLPSMLRRTTGTIVTISSTSGSLDIPYNTAYATSKAAVIKFNQDLWHEVHNKGVRCFTLHPGSVQTDLAKSEGAVNMEAAQSNAGMQAVFGEFQKITYQTPQLAANTCVALCVEEDAALMNGRYIDSQQDLGEVLQHAKDQRERLEKGKLYHLKVEEF